MVYRQAVWRGLLLCAVLVACEADNPRNCEDGMCTDPAFPFCDADGSIAGNPHTCIAPSCEAGVAIECEGSSLVRCNGDGTDYELIPCSVGCDGTALRCNDCMPGTRTCEGTQLKVCGTSGTIETDETCLAGCVASPGAHCAYLEPRYVAQTCTTSASLPKLDITSSGSFDTNLDSNCTGGVVPQVGAAELCVVHYGEIHVAAGRTLKVTGLRALALVADRDVTIDGILDVSADGVTSGPGSVSYSGGAADLTMAAPKGGGGAGFKTAGASGGTTSTTGGAANGGAPTADPAALTVLLGGAKTGASGMTAGGGGGGGATIVSCRGSVSVSGTLQAGGGGGLGGQLLPLGLRSPGWGGGSGGYVVLQGLRVTVTGAVFANGGGGGAGLQADNTMGTPGEDGPAGDASAMGGRTFNGEGVGGTGAWRNGAAGQGGAPTASGALPGGGGGGLGFFQAYVPAGQTAQITPAHASPPFQPSGTVPTR